MRRLIDRAIDAAERVAIAILFLTVLAFYLWAFFGS